MAKKFSHSYEVCACKHVTLGEILYAIKEKNANTIEKIGELTDAGTCCGCCVSSEKDFGEEKMELYLTTILDKFVKVS
ncbi:BFD domain protein (2Fe-2S)-binding domain protein [Arcobacter nitrofigilis DSM 7299]|uniref:BFD domain protein (2Fe-2S)-binding domain protein n=1 Tax=Arcobacter nitrofigilis (strain ATCC 33309 / DSM 7299 / CCUG 15893 / LMG 7604 / NCTC 12251 / CI) TaxID=572480 RepID=D5V1U7_ARCNC|nr:(2Fe-2S)-binding protein [Arcobacter nitrofigilis]ADG93531.1 BFD domain protein (2Fe-2S)-binding domain protein [Arcobacter nitrofigilis DSM 7299]